MPADKGPLHEGFDSSSIPPMPNLIRATVSIQRSAARAGIAECQPLIELLHQLTSLVEGIDSGLTIRLR
jgi:hypothetical protein